MASSFFVVAGVGAVANLLWAVHPLPVAGPPPGRNESQLAADLDSCVAAIPVNETNRLLEHDRGFMQHPRTRSGRYIRCLAQRLNTGSLAVLFHGPPGANGVFSAALGLRARALAGAGVMQLVTAEREQTFCEAGRRFLKRQGLLPYVDLRCKAVCEVEADCLSEVRELFCPAGRLDVLVEDITPPGNLALRSTLEVCAPRVLFVENSGIRDTHPSIMAGNRSLSGEWWAHFMEDEIHIPALERRGPWRIVVNKRLSGFAADAGVGKWQARRFSIYMAVE